MEDNITAKRPFERFEDALEHMEDETKYSEYIETDMNMNKAKLCFCTRNIPLGSALFTSTMRLYPGNISQF